MSRAVLSSLLCVVLAACASGGAPNTQGDDVQKIDAPTSGPHDAGSGRDAPINPPHDGPPGIDAFVFHDAPPPPDAASALFCTANNQCTNAGECCISINGMRSANRSVSPIAKRAGS